MRQAELDRDRDGFVAFGRLLRHDARTGRGEGPVRKEASSEAVALRERGERLHGGRPGDAVPFEKRARFVRVVGRVVDERRPRRVVGREEREEPRLPEARELHHAHAQRDEQRQAEHGLHEDGSVPLHAAPPGSSASSSAAPAAMARPNGTRHASADFGGSAARPAARS